MSICERCGSETNITTMSWFNIQMICKSCDEKELSHKDIEKAKAKDLEQFKQGNYNYEGIGLPSDL
tara:strand:- start:12193 stop:12390 length:198 start_codon:yes stop_codon:yes gene_type:complete